MSGRSEAGVPGITTTGIAGPAAVDLEGGGDGECRGTATDITPAATISAIATGGTGMGAVRTTGRLGPGWPGGNSRRSRAAHERQSPSV
jgi:hypothetical protein